MLEYPTFSFRCRKVQKLHVKTAREHYVRLSIQFVPRGTRFRQGQCSDLGVVIEHERDYPSYIVPPHHHPLARPNHRLFLRGQRARSIPLPIDVRMTWPFSALLLVEHRSIPSGVLTCKSPAPHCPLSCRGCLLRFLCMMLVPKRSPSVEHSLRSILTRSWPPLRESRCVERGHGSRARSVP